MCICTCVDIPRTKHGISGRYQANHDLFEGRLVRACVHACICTLYAHTCTCVHIQPVRHTYRYWLCGCRLRGLQKVTFATGKKRQAASPVTIAFAEYQRIHVSAHVHMFVSVFLHCRSTVCHVHIASYQDSAGSARAEAQRPEQTVCITLQSSFKTRANMLSSEMCCLDWQRT